MKLRILIAVLAAVSLMFVGSTTSSAGHLALDSCTGSRQHVTGTDGQDYIVSGRPINGGNACLTLGTGASYTVTSQTTAERTDDKVLSFPDVLYGCQWGGTGNVLLDCSSGFLAGNEFAADCFWTTSCGGTAKHCKIGQWSTDLAAGESGTKGDEGFDLYAGSSATPDWAHTDTEIFVRTNTIGLGTGYTSWPSVTINGQSWYYNVSTGNQGAWTGDFVQYIRHISKVTFTNWSVAEFMQDAAGRTDVNGRAWLVETDYLTSVRAGQEIVAHGAGTTGGIDSPGELSVVGC